MYANFRNLFMILVTSSFIISQNYWVKYGWQVFNSAGDARILSIGGAAVTDYGTSLSPLFNPASANAVGLHDVNYTHQSRIAGMINSDLIGFPIKNFSRPLNLIILHEGVEDIPDTRNILLDFGVDGVPGTGDAGEGNGILDEGERLDASKLKFFSQRQFGMHLSTAWQKDNYEVGIAFKILRHSLGDFNGTGIGLDFGIVIIPWKNGRLGLTVRDLTTSWQVWDNGTVERFKPTIISGISHSFEIENWPLRITGMSNILLEMSGRSSTEHFSLGNSAGYFLNGINLVYNQRIALRFGRNAIGAITSGIGLSWENISLDYALLNTPTGSGLGSTHLISISMSSEWILNQIEKL